MKTEAKDVALAILTRAKEREGVVNKTKLLKLLYLADIEHFRKFGETLTGFDWIYYLFGPWAAEYEDLLDELVREDAIEIENWSAAELNGAKIHLRESRDLNKVIRDTDEFYRIQHQVDAWADRSLSELLDYVYFETEPMSDAVNGKPLPFGNIGKEAPKLYRRPSSQTHPEALKRLKAKMQAHQRETESRRQTALRDFRPPVFDDVYSAALADLDSKKSQ